MMLTSSLGPDDLAPLVEYATVDASVSNALPTDMIGQVTADRLEMDPLSLDTLAPSPQVTISASGPYVVGSTPSGVQSTPVTCIDFAFSGVLDATSFAIGDDVAAFTGSDGADLRASITSYSWLNGNTTLRISFAAQTASGYYSMTIGPQILSASGAAMEQNQNGVAGKPVADQYTAKVGYDAAPLTVASRCHRVVSGFLDHGVGRLYKRTYGEGGVRVSKQECQRCVCEVGTLRSGVVGGDIELRLAPWGTRGCRFANGLK